MEMDKLEDRFDTRCAQVLKLALEDGLFLARDITPQSDDIVANFDDNQASCAAFLTSQTGATGIVNILWQDYYGKWPFSIFAYTGRNVKLAKDVTYDEICARCFEVNQETPLSNVNYRIDEPELFQKKGEGYIVCVAGLPLLPFEVELNYENNGACLETLLVGAMESAFAGEQMIPALFEEYIDSI